MCDLYEPSGCGPATCAYGHPLQPFLPQPLPTALDGCQDGVSYMPPVSPNTLRVAQG